MTAVDDKAQTAPQSAAAPSPFPPIAEYAFLSDCHTGALIAPDGGIGWLCVPRFDAPSVFGTLLDRQAGYFRLAPFGINVPSSRRYEPGTNILETTWHTPSGWVVVRDALTMGPRRHEDTITPHTRPPTDDDAEHLLVRTVRCIDGNVEVELVCEPVFDYGRVPGEWTLVGDDRHVADASGAEQTIRLSTDMALGIEGNTVRARHAAHRGRRALLRAVVGRGPGLAGRPRRRQRAPGADHPLLAHVALPRPASRPRVDDADPALGAGDQGPDLHADRRDGGRADHVAARDAGRRAQLGLPLHVDARLDLHAAGAALPQPRLGGRRVHAVRRRPRAQRGRRAADHVRDRRAPRSHRVARATTSPATPARARSASATAPSTSARTTSSAPRWTRSCCTRGAASGCRAGCGRSCRRRPSARPRSGASPTRASGRRAASRSTTSRRSSCAGSRSTARPSWPTSRGEPAAQRRPGRATAEEIKADILEHGVDARGVLRQHYATDALDASTLLAALFGFLPRDDERLRASVLAIADELTEHGFVLRYSTDETDDGLSGKEGTFLICSFWLVSALAIIGEHQRARDLMERLLRRRLAARALRRGVRRRHRPAPRQLPAGLLAPRADRGRRRGSSSPSDWRSSAMSDYDVIVIGSRRRRRDARPAPRPVGQAHPAARARRLAPARAAELARAGRLRRQPLRVAGHVVRRRRQALPAAGALLRRRRHEALRRRAVPPAQGGLRRAAPPRRHLAGVAHRATTRWSRTTRGPSSSTRCTAPAARTRPSRRPARPTRSRR